MAHHKQPLQAAGGCLTGDAEEWGLTISTAPSFLHGKGSLRSVVDINFTENVLSIRKAVTSREISGSGRYLIKCLLKS